jgi:hypothetical protein
MHVLLLLGNVGQCIKQCDRQAALQCGCQEAATFVEGTEAKAVWGLHGTCRYDFQQASTTKQVSSLQASWDNFTDPQSGVVGYTVQFFQQVRSLVRYYSLPRQMQTVCSRTCGQQWRNCICCSCCGDRSTPCAAANTVGLLPDPVCLLCWFDH